MGVGRLEDRVCLITGGARGFGASIVSLFVSQGARCVVLDLLLPSTTQQAGFYDPYTIAPPCIPESDSAVQVGDERAYAIQTDITTRTGWQSALQTCKSVFGSPPSIVINNAGWTYSNKPTLEVTEKEFERVFEVNVKSIFCSVDVVLPELIAWSERPDAVFVNVSSTAANRPRPGLTWYCASKGAVSTATKALALEYAPYKIRFNTVCPVAGNTPLLSKFAGSSEAGDAMTSAQLQQFNASIPLGRLAEPSDVANACLFLAEPASQFITGIELPVDGGRSV